MGVKDKVGNVKKAFDKSAKFSFCYIDSDITSISDNDWEGPYKIDINPTEFAEYYSESYNFSDGMNVKRKKKSSKNKKGKVGQGKGLVDKYTSISLIFDLSEEYDSAISRVKAGYKGKNSIQGSKFKKFTKGMKKGFTQGSPEEDTAISILNPAWSAYAYLEEMMDEMSANNAYCVVKFEWGVKRVIGIVESINTNFSYFSSHGAPLRAEVSMTIQHDEGWIKVSNSMVPIEIKTQTNFTEEEIQIGMIQDNPEAALSEFWGENGDVISGLFGSSSRR